MQREILFRGKDIGGKDWFYGSYLRTDDNTNDCFGGKNINIRHQIVQYEAGDWNLGGWAYYDVIPETIGQFTGLKDKNGKKIFEGDIIKFTRKQGYHTAYTGDTYMISFYNKSYCGYGINDTSPLTNKKSKECIVIGNIHDNPELLKQWNS